MLLSLYCNLHKCHDSGCAKATASRLGAVTHLRERRSPLVSVFSAGQEKGEGGTRWLPRAKDLPSAESHDFLHVHAHPEVLSRRVARLQSRWLPGAKDLPRTSRCRLLLCSKVVTRSPPKESDIRVTPVLYLALYLALDLALYLALYPALNPALHLATLLATALALYLALDPALHLALDVRLYLTPHLHTPEDTTTHGIISSCAGLPAASLVFRARQDPESRMSSVPWSP